VSELPDSYFAVHQDERLLLLRDQHPPPRELAEEISPQTRDLAILRALWRYRFLLTSQIAREWWPGCSLWAAQRRLGMMAAAGWVTRIRPRLSKGKHEWVYQLDREGFELARATWGLEGPYIPTEAKWRARHVRDYGVILHDLQVNAWVMAYRELAGDRVIDWLGPDQGRLDVPTVYENRRFRPITAEEVEISTYSYARDLRLGEHLRPVVPDATLRLYLEKGACDLDLLIELDRTRRPIKNIDKLHRYDALLTAWWRSHERYRSAKKGPAVVFVCVDEEAAFNLMETAHKEITGRIARTGTPQETWRSPGRSSMFFVAEEDIHDGSMRAWMLSKDPPDPENPRLLGEREVLLPGAR
jgi:hypothetical protein